VSIYEYRGIVIKIYRRWMIAANGEATALPSDVFLTIAKPESRADVLLDALSFARLSCSFLQDK